MIGNDIVDLGEPELDPRLRNPRFDQRVFSEAERVALKASGAPERLRWIFWAAKEAAYKVARKIDPKTVFSPPRFDVQLNADLRGIVHHETRDYFLLVEEGEGRIHAIATEEGPLDKEQLWNVIPFEGDAGTASKAVRALALRELAAELGLPFEDLEVRRIERIPVAIWNGKELDIDLSLSHHGRFLAFGCDLRAGASSWRDEREPAWTSEVERQGAGS